MNITCPAVVVSAFFTVMPITPGLPAPAKLFPFKPVLAL